MKKYLLGATVAVASLTSLGVAHATPSPSPFPAVGLVSGPDIVFTFGAGGSVTTTVNSTTPYDGSDDSYIGVVNNSGQTLNSFTLTGNTDIFGFDGDGINTFLHIANNAQDTTGYGGPDAFFRNISLTLKSGTVNFIGGIASGSGTTAGDTGYFSLEGPPSAINVVVNQVPEPASLALLGVGLGAFGLLRRRKA